MERATSVRVEGMQKEVERRKIGFVELLFVPESEWFLAASVLGHGFYHQ